jgi:hypothetical protein
MKPWKTSNNNQETAVERYSSTSIVGEKIRMTFQPSNNCRKSKSMR